MTTVLGIVMAVFIALNVWLGIYTAKMERKRRKQLQERMDEYDEFVGKHLNEMGTMKERLNGVMGELANAKSTILSLQEEYDALKKEYHRLVSIQGDPHAEPQEPVDGGPVNSDVTPTEPKLRKVNIAALDLQDLRKSYDELAKRYENPSKTYLVRNIVKVYDVQSRTQLAKALGVSQQSINQMLRKK